MERKCWVPGCKSADDVTVQAHDETAGRTWFMCAAHDAATKAEQTDDWEPVE